MMDRKTFTKMRNKISKNPPIDMWRENLTPDQIRYLRNEKSYWSWVAEYLDYKIGFGEDPSPKLLDGENPKRVELYRIEGEYWHALLQVLICGWEHIKELAKGANAKLPAFFLVAICQEHAIKEAERCHQNFRIDPEHKMSLARAIDHANQWIRFMKGEADNEMEIIEIMKSGSLSTRAIAIIYPHRKDPKIRDAFKALIKVNQRYLALYRQGSVQCLNWSKGIPHWSKTGHRATFM